MRWGRPYGAPGEVYRYSDTGYNALAEIIEQITGASSYGVAIRALTDFEKLGIRETWLEDLEPRPADTGERAHQYLDGVSNFDHDASEDLYGGGGLVATVADLLRFYRALFNRAVFRHADTIDVMLSTVMAKRGGPIAYNKEQIPGQYRMGISVHEVAGLICYEHTGYFGTAAAHFPDLGATVALTVNVAESDAGEHLLERVAIILTDDQGRIGACG